MASRNEQRKRRLPQWMEAVHDQRKKIANFDNHQHDVLHQSSLLGIANLQPKVTHQPSGLGITSVADLQWDDAYQPSVLGVTESANLEPEVAQEPSVLVVANPTNLQPEVAHKPSKLGFTSSANHYLEAAHQHSSLGITSSTRLPPEVPHQPSELGITSFVNIQSKVAYQHSALEFTNSSELQPDVAHQPSSEQLGSQDLEYCLVSNSENQKDASIGPSFKPNEEAAKTLPETVSTKKSNAISQELTAAEILSKSMPVLTFQGEIIYSYNHSDCACICQDILSALSSNKKTLVGFDTEWPVSFRNGTSHKTALIQMCFSEDICYLFHVSAMKMFPGPLKNLICDSRIDLVGLNIENDLWKLEMDYDIRVKPIIDKGSVIDIGELANKKLKSAERWSLDGLCRNVLRKLLKKDVELRCGAWDEFPLSIERKVYAATDAFAGLLLHKHLSSI